MGVPGMGERREAWVPERPQHSHGGSGHPQISVPGPWHPVDTSVGGRGTLEFLPEVLDVSSPQRAPSCRDLHDAGGVLPALRLSPGECCFLRMGILLPLCQPHKLQIRGKAWKWLSIYVNGLTGLASALAFVALILWSYDQGLSAALILPLFLLIYVAMVTLLVVGTVAFKMDMIHQITDPAAQRLVDFSTPTGVILVTVTCSLLIRQVVKLEGETGRRLKFLCHLMSSEMWGDLARIGSQRRKTDK
ncbi:Hypothetical predicted protein [Podarcis lilfordi]|uniref:Uncharacterized protein n=1 Tax=Podarcis lilfordi TaxID=74358 RepID=A0AA35QQ43_9SAUR|nr:Hypothetical predicted protein [Podarcis lilfordi]